MCGLRIFLRTLFFLLALGPDIMLLHAQESVSTESSVVTESQTESPVESTASVDSEESQTNETFTQNTAGPTEGITTTRSSSRSTSFKATVVSQELTSGTQEQETKPSEPGEPSVTMVTPTMTEPHTAMITGSTAPAFTTAPSDDTTAVSDVIPATTMHIPFTTHVQTSASETAQESTEATETTSTPITHTEKRVETTPSTMATTQIITTFYQHPVRPDFTDFATQEAITSPPDVLSTISEITEQFIMIGGPDPSIVEQESSEQSSTGSNLLIIIIIAVAIICIVAAFCVVIFVRRNKKSRSQSFGQGYTNGRSQRSKKKKGEEDAWAGPVNLEGGDKAECDGPEEMGQGGDKNPDGTDMMLSTFVASEGNGGVGRPGSMEAQKWEEQEPLLYIDEEAKAGAKEKQSEGVGKAKEVEQKEDGMTDMKEPNQNGGDAFCITTAV